MKVRLRIPVLALTLASFASLACTGPLARRISPHLPGGVATGDVNHLDLDVYRRAGFMVGTGGVPFVAFVRYLGGATPDTTLALVGLSIPPRGLSFERKGDLFRAEYTASVRVLRDSLPVHETAHRREVRVSRLQETQRADEGVIFQHIVALSPGRYTFNLTVRNDDHAPGGVAAASLLVPRIADGSVSSLIPVYAAIPRTGRADLPQLIVRPRSTATLGRDSTVAFYVESYGPRGTDRLVLGTRADRSTYLFRDTLSLSGGDEVRAAISRLPVSKLGIGLVPIIASHPGGRFAAASTVLADLGENIGVASFAELVSLLRYFVHEHRLRPLRDTVPERRVAAWIELLRETDPIPETPENEALREYMRRIHTANLQFRDEGIPGWQTDRGMVYAILGEFDAVLEPAIADTTSAAPRPLIWEYRRHNAVFTFTDVTGLGKWRLTPASDSELQSLVGLLGMCIGCAR